MLPILWMTACVAAEPPADPTPATPVDYVLEEPKYRFCHEAGQDLEEALAFCELLEDSPKEWCPGMRQTCAGGVSNGRASAGCGSPRGTGGLGGQGAEDPATPQTGSEGGCGDFGSSGCDAPEPADVDLWGVFRWVSAFGVALLLLVIVRMLVRFFGRPSSNPTVTEVATIETDVPALEELQDIPDLPSRDLLANARRALEEGDAERAILYARAASLRGLSESGMLRLHRSKTDREYVRSVRKDPEVRDALRTVTHAVESLRWGGRRMGLDAASSVLEAAGRLLAVGVALLVLLQSSAEAQAERHGPSGDMALFDLMTRYGYDVRWREADLMTLDSGTVILVVDREFTVVEEEDWDAIEGWVERGGVLWLAGEPPERWSDLGHRHWMENVQETALWHVWEGRLSTPRTPTDTWVWSGGLGQDLVWVHGDSGMGAVVSQVAVGSGWVVGVADSAMFWNGALVSRDNNDFWGQLPQVGGLTRWMGSERGRIDFLAAAVPEGPSPTDSIVQSNLWPFLVQFLAFWAVLVVSAGWAFSPHRASRRRGEQPFGEHVRALGSRWWRAGASATVAAAMARLWAARLGQDGLVRAARAAGRPERDARAFAQDVLDRASEDVPLDGDLDWKFVEELWTITRNR